MHPPRLATTIIRSLLPEAERDEVIADITAEYVTIAGRAGVAAADAWAWRQARRSVPALVRRAWWRGWTGFESEGNRHKPGGIMLEQWIQDTRFATRRLRKRPMFAVLAIMTLALGVGGTAAVYSLVRNLLLHPLPYSQPETLAYFWHPFDWSQSEYFFMQDGNHPGFTDVAMYSVTDLTLTPDEGATKSVPTVLPSDNLFNVLGVKAFMGRTLLPSDNVPGAPSIIILSYDLWQELGSDPQIIGRKLRGGGEPQLVVGVMPKGFWFPDPQTKIWANSPFRSNNRSGNYAAVGRLEPGRTFANMDEPLRVLTSRLRDTYHYSPQWDKSKDPVLTPMLDALAGQLKPVLLATLGAMALILLIACANVAALMLGQVDSRSTEFAVRSSLGANKRQLLQQLIIETLVIGISAAIAGSLLAAASFGLIIRALPLGPMVANATLDWSVFLAALAISLGAAVLVAAAPAISLWRGDLRDSLTKSRTGGIGARGGSVENALVVVEVALALLVVTGAALLIRTVGNLRSIDPGIDVNNVATVQVISDYMTPVADRQRIMREALQNLSALPGVESAAVTQMLPITCACNNWGFEAEGMPPARLSTTAFRAVSKDYLKVMRIRILEGRDFNATDELGGDTVVIINETTKKEFFGSVDPIGRRVTTGAGGQATVIGVAEDVMEARLTDGHVAARYMLETSPSLPLMSSAFAQNIVIRVKPGNRPESILEAARDVIVRTSSTLAVKDMTTMKNVFDRAVGPALQLMDLLILLGGLALTLGAIGVYGVVSHFVTRRKREWSIRMALGLRPATLIAQIVTRGGTLVVTGAVIGLVIAAGSVRLLRTFLYNVKPADGASLLSAMLVLVLAGLLAAFVPAWRASRADAARVLREQ